MKIKILLLLLTAWQCFAINYFVLPTGSDDNAGTSSEAAFLHHPWDTGATGTSNATTLVSGDTVWLKGGEIYIGKIQILSSGTTGSPIVTITKPGWGTGQAIFSGNRTIAPLVTMNYQQRSNWTIENILFKNVKNAVGTEYTFELYGGSTRSDGILIDSCVVDSGSGAMIFMFNNVSPIIKNCIIRNGLDDGIKGEGANGTTIENCQIYEFMNYAAHPDAMQLYGYSYSDTIYIKNNFITRVDQGLMLSRNEYLSTSDGGMFVVTGNIFLGWYEGPGVDEHSSNIATANSTSETGEYHMRGISMFNNTMVGYWGTSYGIFGNGSNARVDTIDIRNNLTYGVVWVDPPVTTYNKITHDYNVYTNSTHAATEANGQYWTLSIAETFIDSASTNFGLLTNTNAGVDLGSLYNVDRGGNPRTTWTRGAYEFISAIPITIGKCYAH